MSRPKAKAKTTSQLRVENVAPLVRVFPSDKAFLEKLAKERSQSIAEALNGVIERYKRQEFFHDLAGAYAELKKDKSAWNAEIKERRLYENASCDGILD